MPELLVHLHLYYEDQLNYFIKKLKNITDCNWDLYVTVIEENPEIIKKILKFKPDAKIIKVNNIGYDIYPFIQVIKSVDLNKYDYVLKLHTKRILKNKKEFKDTNKGIYLGWRNSLVDALIGSKEIFIKNLNILSEENVGMLFCHKYLFSLTDYSRTIDIENLELLKKNLGINTNYQYFVAGSMFMVKSSVLKLLVKMNFREKDFMSNKQQSYMSGTLAHTIERVFTLLTDDAGLKICTIDITSKEDSKYYLMYKVKQQLKKIFSISNDNTHKVLIALGIKFKFKSKKLIEQKMFEDLNNQFDTINIKIKNQIDKTNAILNEISSIRLFHYYDALKFNYQFKLKKILLISHDLSIAGASLSLFYIAKILKSIFSVEVLSLAQGKLQECYKKEDILCMIFPQNVSEDFFVLFLKQFDLIIVNTIIPNYFVDLCNKYNLNYIWLIREAQNIPLYYGKTKNLANTIEHSNNIVVTSEYAKEFIDSEYKQNVKVLHNYIEDEFEFFKEINQNNIIFSIVGYFDIRKAQDICIDAFLQLTDNKKVNWKLNIVGEMCEWNRAYWEPLYNKTITDNRFNWTGLVTGDAKKEIFKNTDVFLVPSLDESCSRVVLEAMMYGKPVVISENVGASYMVNKDTGWIVKTGNVKSLRDCIENILQNTNKLSKMGQCARQMYLSTSTREIYENNLLNMINKYLKLGEADVK